MYQHTPIFIIPPTSLEIGPWHILMPPQCLLLGTQLLFTFIQLLTRCCRISGLQKGTTYYFYMVQVNQFGASDPSDIFFVTTAGGKK